MRCFRSGIWNSAGPVGWMKGVGPVCKLVRAHRLALHTGPVCKASLVCLPWPGPIPQSHAAYYMYVGWMMGLCRLVLVCTLHL